MIFKYQPLKLLISKNENSYTKKIENPEIEYIIKKIKYIIKKINLS